MKKLLLLFFTLFYCNSSLAQKRNNIWCFGDSAGVNFNFPIPQTFTTQSKTRGSATSIADTSGNLIFYTSYTPWGTNTRRVRVFNNLNQIIQNGDSIVGIGWYMENVIVPMPSNPMQYYLFSVGVTSSIPGFYYSIIDMDQNGGLGSVTQKNVQLLPFEISDGLQAVKHGNGRDWWVICRRCDITSNEHLLFLITPTGILGPYSQTIGTSTYTNTTRTNFSFNGNKIVETNFSGLIEIFDFDRCTGILSNSRIIHEEGNPYLPFWCSEFSHNQNILYVSTNEISSSLFQLNLLDTNPWMVRDTLWVQDSIQYSGGALELAPNGKIYYASAWYDGLHFNYPYPDSAYYPENMNLGVINYPDNLGAACDFQPYSFYLGGSRTYIGLPNNPNYDMPAIPLSICDSLSVGFTQSEIVNKELKVFYHPGWQIAFINAEGLTGKSYAFAVYDLMGNEVFKEQGRLTTEYFTKDLPCSGLTKGMYIVTLQTERVKLVKRFVRE